MLILAAYRALTAPLRLLLEFLAPHFAFVEELLAPRRGLLDRWRRANLGENPIWFHVSSVGELEQVRPVLEKLRLDGHNLVLSYFSSSVPRVVKDWGFVRYADYLPLDFEKEMEELLDIVKPRLLVLNRYDLWPNHLEAARRRRVPVVIVNASTPPLGLVGKIGLRLRRRLFLGVVAWTFVDGAAADGWEPYVLDRAKGLVTGDPRVDRALGRVENALREGKSKSQLARWERENFCLVAGSTWAEDEEVLLQAWRKLEFPRSLVIVPHEPDEAHLKRLEKSLDQLGFSHGRFSRGGGRTDVLLVDQRGMLAELYGFGQLAYVGGGFRKHIHSIIEPVAHGLPVAFGPNFRRSPEAITLKSTGSAFSLGSADPEALATWIRTMAVPGSARERAEEPIRIFLQIHRGAGERVAHFLETCLGAGR